jgi:hypothetical protein
LPETSGDKCSHLKSGKNCFPSSEDILWLQIYRC